MICFICVNTNWTIDYVRSICIDDVKFITKYLKDNNSNNTLLYKIEKMLESYFGVDLDKDKDNNVEKNILTNDQLEKMGEIEQVGAKITGLNKKVIIDKPKFINKIKKESINGNSK